MADARTAAQILGGEVRGARVVCPGPNHSPSDRSLSIRFDPSAPDGFTCNSFAGDDWKTCRDYIKDRLGITRGTTWQPDPAEIARRERAEAERDARMVRHASSILCKAVSARGTVVERYLERRGLTGQIPKSIGYLPNAWHPDGRFPAMVANIERGSASSCVEFTYLSPDGRKAGCTPARWYVGKPAGGGVCLKRGHGPHVVGEGIESTMSALRFLPEAGPTWAATSAPNMAAFNLPPGPGQLIIALDADRAGREAGRVLGDRAISMNWDVQLFEPPVDGWDWNDFLIREE